MDTPAPNVALRIETVQADCHIVVGKRFRRVRQEEICGSAVKVGGRILRFLLYVPVEIFNSLVELLGEEISHSPAVIQADQPRTKLHRRVQVSESLIVFT